MLRSVNFVVGSARRFESLRLFNHRNTKCTHFHLEPTSRMGETSPPCLHTPDEQGKLSSFFLWLFVTHAETWPFHFTSKVKVIRQRCTEWKHLENILSLAAPNINGCVLCVCWQKETSTAKK